MDKKRFEQWVKKIYSDFQKDKQAIAYFGSHSCVIVYDTATVKSAIAKCRPEDVFDCKTGIAIAYARLKGFEIPKIEEEPKFKRVKTPTPYYYISNNVNGRIICYSKTEYNGIYDNCHYDNNNYFHTEKRAEEVADKINFLLKLERLHDTYCPGYVPDWSNDKDHKHYIYYDEKAKRWNFDSVTKMNVATVYFPTSKIAQKVCNILNEERGNNER